MSQCLCIVCCIASLPIFCAKVRLYWICVGACGGGVFNPAPLTDDTSSIIGAPLRIFICPPLICLLSKVVCPPTAPQQGGLPCICRTSARWFVLQLHLSKVVCRPYCSLGSLGSVRVRRSSGAANLKITFGGIFSSH